MAHAFNTIPAKPAFGTLRNNINQNTYINRKRGQRIFCSSKTQCNQLKVAKNYNFINSFNTGRYASDLENCKFVPINKNNLIIGQYTKMDLNNVCSVSHIDPSNQPIHCSSTNPCTPCQNNTAPVIINPSAATTPFYFSNQIDPLGQLFGKTQCGELNYTQYMKYYPRK